MRSVVVGNPHTRFWNRLCHGGCNQRTKPGQAIVWHRLEPKGYSTDLFVAHVECLQAVLDRAPSGVPVRRAALEFDRIKKRAQRLALTR